MFDPFGDFKSAGYLRNVRKDKHEVSIKSAEHTFFRIKLDAALKRGHWGERIFSMSGLDGAVDSKDQANLLSDPAVLEKYQQFEAGRAYRYLASPVSGDPGNGDVRQ